MDFDSVKQEENVIELPKCDRCGLEIKSNKVVTCFTTDNTYHPDCVKCGICNRSMNGLIKSLRKQDGSGSDFFHARCFKCSTCKKTYEDLKMNKFTYQNFKIQCKSCIPCVICKKNNCDSEIDSQFSHHKCITDAFCYICGDNNPVYNKRICNGNIKHIDCLTDICHVCDTILGKEINVSKINNKTLGIKFNIHNTCGALVFPNCATCCKRSHNIKNIWGLSQYWNKQNHLSFPQEVRLTIFEMLKIYNRGRITHNYLSLLPRDVFLLICRWVATPDMWETFNGVPVNTICTTSRCCNSPSRDFCELCRDPISWVLSNKKCSQHKCISYSHKCTKCSNLITYGADLVNVCSKERCIFDTCIKCKGILKYGSEDTRNICSKDNCLLYTEVKCSGYNCKSYILRDGDFTKACTSNRCIKESCSKCKGELLYGPEDTRSATKICSKMVCIRYHDKKCKCGDLIKRNIIEPLKECTQYRCIRDKCTECGLDLSPYNTKDSIKHLGGDNMCHNTSYGTPLCVTQKIKYSNLLDLLFRELKPSNFNKIDSKFIAVHFDNLLTTRMCLDRTNDDRVLTTILINALKQFKKLHEMMFNSKIYIEFIKNKLLDYDSRSIE